MRASHAASGSILINEPQNIEFTQQELYDFWHSRGKHLNSNTYGQIKRTIDFIWDICKGRFTQITLQTLTDFYMSKYPSESQREKCFNYTRAFMKYLFKIRMNTNILSFIAIFEKPKTRRETKMLTSRIIIQDDIENALTAIKSDTTLSDERGLNYTTLLLFLSYSGQRTVTASRLTISQFKDAQSKNPHVLTVEAKQDKIRLQHYVPLHPILIPLIERLEQGKDNKDTLFDYLGLQRWLKAHPVPLTHTKGKLELKDIRKFFEQKSDEIGFTDANKNFIMSHGVSSIGWTSYKQFLPENVYKRYLECWENVVIIARVEPEIPLQDSNLHILCGKNGVT